MGQGKGEKLALPLVALPNPHLKGGWIEQDEARAKRNIKQRHKR